MKLYRRRLPILSFTPWHSCLVLSPFIAQDKNYSLPPCLAFPFTELGLIYWLWNQLVIHTYRTSIMVVWSQDLKWFAERRRLLEVWYQFSFKRYRRLPWNCLAVSLSSIHGTGELFTLAPARSLTDWPEKHGSSAALCIWNSIFPEGVVVVLIFFP